MKMPVPPILARCPVCQGAYGDGAVSLVGKEAQGMLYHCHCAQCGQTMLALVMEIAGTLSSIGLLTDLGVQDVAHFHTIGPIQADECVLWHEWLTGHSQEWCQTLLHKTGVDKTPKT